MDTKNIKISDYNYPLDENRIAKFPLSRRDNSKLLIYRNGNIGEDVFRNLPQHVPQDALMVFNNTKVIMARMRFRKSTGALIEVFLLEPLLPADYQVAFLANGQCEWCCLVGNLKKWKGETLTMPLELGGRPLTLCATRVGEEGTGHRVRFQWDRQDVSFAELIDVVGELPIPPYLNRATQESDKTTYQTVYSKVKGSVAAPTAGLHFTPEVLDDLDRRGIKREEVTLHVGAGTFRPVKSERIQGHEMHAEHFYVKRETIQALIEKEGNVLAVGTTSVRTLESLYFIGAKLRAGATDEERCLHVAQWEPYDNPPKVMTKEALEAIDDYMDRHQLKALQADTHIIIAPGYDFKIVNMMVTNFHQPQSTLLLLVSAFVKGDWRSIYDYALANNFRFLSYGDSSLIIPCEKQK
jgi:S-adenosylmethionine:tRNA ribosyltransferase-isomerase